MIVNHTSSGPSTLAPAEYFTGTVRRDGLVNAEPPGRAATGLVTFEPGARTAWHTHPAGQILIVTAGRGWVRSEGQPRIEVTAGDSVWIPADERHWHGATDTTAMTHIAVTEFVDGSAVTWLEHVSDEDYLAVEPLGCCRIKCTGRVKPNAPPGNQAVVGLGHVPPAQACQPVPLLQLVAGGDPAGGADVRPIPA